MPAKKLIEVSLPLDDINKHSAEEKSIRHGHPSTLHLWWARRPLATARAVIWASLVDDPSSHPELFPTDEEQQKERERLFDILKRIVVWDNFNNESLLRVAREEILKYTDGNPPELLDPFAGGGSIPLEAQRLGLRVHAHDLNPVAVMINKAMIEIPGRFAGMPPVNPESRLRIGSDTGWTGASGLAEDVKYYGARMKEEAFSRIGHLYPKISTPEGDATVIAWIWARTVKCPNPACGCDMPLVNSFVLSKKKGRESYIDPVIADGKISYRVRNGSTTREGTVTRSGAKCICCGTPVELDYIRGEAKSQRMGARLMAVVAEGKKGRLYISPDDEHIKAADVPMPEDYPNGTMPNNPRWFSPPLYGMTEYKDLFTPRQLTMLTTLSGLIPEMQREIENDALKAGAESENARAYAEAVSVYLAFVVDRQLNYSTTLNIWGGEFIAQTFSRQALPMVWDFAESNPFSNSTGSFTNAVDWVENVISRLPSGHVADVSQNDARNDCGIRNVMISTDPPYYDNIGYADLSDFFYIWMRKSLRNIYPELFSRMLVPKTEELIATPYRHNNDMDEAKSFFERGMFEACRNFYLYARDDIPLTIYYAYKQKENDGEQKESSSGWETMLSAVIKAGFVITGTWPMRTERPTALKKKVNALASSIVLVCRKRPENASPCTRRNFLMELKRELPESLRKLQASSIAPVDMAQSAIGPGMAVYSKYSGVYETDGTPITVRTALQIINQALSDYLGGQETDKETLFCTDLYAQKGFDPIRYGEADVLARAKNVSVDSLSKMGLVREGGGYVQLIPRGDIELKVTADVPPDWLLIQRLARGMTDGGREMCAKILAPLMSASDRAKNLAYRLYSIADRRKWNDEAYTYNTLVTEWPEIMKRANELKKNTAEQLSIVFNVSGNGEESK